MAVAEGLLLLCAISVLQPLVGALSCVHSGLCSIDKLKPFVGDIYDGSTLRAALAARSYKREVIFMVATSHRMVPTLQAVANLRRFGLEHILMISTDEDECKGILRYLPHLGCVWDRFKLPMIGKNIDAVIGTAPLWHTRWRTMARAMRLRYNVLCMDSDVIVFDDPYRYFKSPPFKDFVILNQPEVLFHETEYPDNTYPNGGFVYVQNAAPDGPAAWLVAEVSDRLLRWVEDEFKTLEKRGMQTWCCYLDQDCFTDALSSVQTGRPLWQWAIGTCTYEWYKEQTKGAREIELANNAMVEHAWSHATGVRVPAWMQRRMNITSADYKWFSMKMPNYAGVWAAELGGNLYPPQRGNMSTEFMHQMRTDCDCPMWPDPEDASQAAKANATKQEKFMFVPPWITLGYFPRGRLGYWNTDIVGPNVPQVVGHAHYIPETDASVGKNVMKMVSGHYDWGIAHSINGESVYFANQYSGGPTRFEKDEVKRTLPRLVALHPRIELDKLTHWEEFAALLIGLAQVATVSGRAVLWPEVSCDVPWIATGDTRKADTLPLTIRREWFPWGRKGQLKCIWLHYMLESCLFDQRGMVSAEFEHLRERLGLTHDLEPSRHNTAFIPGVLRGPKPGTPPAAQIVRLPEADVAAHMANFTADQVVYIAHPVQVALSRDTLAQYGDLYLSCTATHYYKLARYVGHHVYPVPLPTPAIQMWPGSIRGGRMFSKPVSLIGALRPDGLGIGEWNETMAEIDPIDLDAAEDSSQTATAAGSMKAESRDATAARKLWQHKATAAEGSLGGDALWAHVAGTSEQQARRRMLARGDY